jgi:hypothetical protein
LERIGVLKIDEALPWMGDAVSKGDQLMDRRVPKQIAEAAGT